MSKVDDGERHCTIAGTDIVPLAGRPVYDGPRYEDPVDLDVADIVAMFDDDQADDADETWDYMTDLLEAGEIDPDDFRHQMRSVGYSEEEIDNAIRDQSQDSESSDGSVVADTPSNETATDVMAHPSPMGSRSCDVIKTIACGVAGVAPGPSEPATRTDEVKAHG